jgi:OOP family OmpA-OmpF porin
MARGAILAAGAVALIILAFVCLPRHLPPAASPSPLTSATFHARLENGTLMLRGSVPSETLKNPIVSRAQEVYGTQRIRIVDELSVDPKVASASWLAAVPAVLPILGRMSERSSVIIDGHSLVLSGRVETERTKAAVLNDAAPLIASGLELENHVLVISSSNQSSSTLQAKLDTVLKQSAIPFESNSAKLTPRGRMTLDKLVPLLKREPQAAIEIAGHTDGYGAVDYNRELSRRRAEAVREYLVGRGVANRFVAVGYGASRPLSADKTRAGLQRNRRIELRVKGSAEL